MCRASRRRPTKRTEHFALQLWRDFLPTPERWSARREGVVTTVTGVVDNQAEIDTIVQEHSPRWRIDRMPPIDRILLRIGVYELRHAEKPNARATLNGLIELAKKYGEGSSPRFVNGILDQIRKSLGVPFRPDKS